MDFVIPLTPYDEMLKVFVKQLEAMDVPVTAAFWVLEDDGRWCLYLVHEFYDRETDSLDVTGQRYMALFSKIVEVKSSLLDRMPDLDDVIIRLVGPENAVVQAFSTFHHIGPDAPKKVSYLNADTAYIERALILKAA